MVGVRRVGHAGTLDPDATGVLVVLLGRATGAMRFMLALPKAYRAEVVLGVSTDTQDASGRILRVADVEEVSVSQERFRDVLARFCGALWQVPPMVSAVHHEGRRLYELARKGVEVEREPRRVWIHEIALESWPDDAKDGLATVGSRVTLSVVCSSGTYIRQLAADIGEELGCGAHLGSLVRTAVGSFDLASSHTLEEIEACAARGCLGAMMLPLSEGLSHLPGIVLGEQDSRRIAHGACVEVPVLAQDRPTAGAEEDSPEIERFVRVHGPPGELLCVARVERAEGGDGYALLRPVRVFAS